MKRNIAALLLTCTIILGLLPCSAYAEDSELVSASIDEVYGGRAGIVTLTFDDGNYETVENVDKIFEKYGLRGTIMMIATRVKNGASKWMPFLESGRFEIQNHSMNHLGFRNNNQTDAENFNEATYENEILASKELLEERFPNTDIITYAIPYGAWCDEAAGYAMTEHYMVRSTRSGVQSLNPGFELNEVGNWSLINCTAINVAINPAQMNTLKAQVDEAATGGWLCTIVHHVGDMSTSEISCADADELFGYIAEYQNDGKLWVTDTASATKYIRERQNATLTAIKTEKGIKLKANLAEKTADGLPLDTDVFNHPLTVKVEVDEGIDTLYYLNGCTQKSAKVFTQGGKRYARVELIPNGEELLLSPTAINSENLPHDFADATCTEPMICKICGYTGGTSNGHDYADATCIAPKICNICGNRSGTALGHDYADATCTAPKTCTRCDKTRGDPDGHDYKKATCQAPETCKSCGNTVGNPLDHSYSDATCTAPKTCKDCGATDGEPIAHNDSNADKICDFCFKNLDTGTDLHENEENSNDSAVSPALIILTVAIVSCAAVATVILIRKRHKK